MKINALTNNTLHFCFPGCQRTPQRAPRIPQPVDFEIQPLLGRTTVFSVPHAALACGMLELAENTPATWENVLAAARAKWGRSAKALFDEAAEHGANSEFVDNAGAVLPLATIIWRWDQKRASRTDFGLCSDLALTISFFGRRIGNLCLDRRPHRDLSWSNLFSGMFEVNGAFEGAPSLNRPPWSQFTWEIKG